MSKPNQALGEDHVRSHVDRWWVIVPSVVGLGATFFDLARVLRTPIERGERSSMIAWAAFLILFGAVFVRIPWVGRSRVPRILTGIAALACGAWVGTLLGNWAAGLRFEAALARAQAAIESRADVTGLVGIAGSPLEPFHWLGNLEGTERRGLLVLESAPPYPAFLIRFDSRTGAWSEIDG